LTERQTIEMFELAAIPKERWGSRMQLRMYRSRQMPMDAAKVFPHPIAPVRTASR